MNKEKHQCMEEFDVKGRKNMQFFCVKNRGHRGNHQINIQDQTAFEMISNVKLGEIAEKFWSMHTRRK